MQQNEQKLENLSSLDNASFYGAALNIAIQTLSYEGTIFSEVCYISYL